jgi:hypothetical protein
MKITELLEDISQQELDHVEIFADQLWAKLGVDIEFTRHFLDRVNDERNGKPIEADELIALFQKEFKTNGIQISNMRRPEAVLKDLLSNINIPFVLKKDGDKKQLVGKTVMRKRNFMSPNPAYVVKELFQQGKDWKWSFQGSEEAVAVFHVGEIPYMFHAWGADSVWEVEFKRHGSKLDRSTKFGLTGTGNSAEVMSTVVDIMRAFLVKYKGKIETLVFSAKEDSRQSLYAKMTKRLLPNWSLHQDGGEFTLVAPSQNVAETSAKKQI